MKLYRDEQVTMSNIWLVIIICNMALRILQINIRGMMHNKIFLEDFLHRENIDVAILSEIKMNKKTKIDIKNYQIFANFQNDYDLYPSGGVAVALLVKKKFIVSSVLINKYLPI